MGSHFWLNLIATTYILLKALHFHCRLKMIRIIVLLGLFLFISGVHPSSLPPGIDYEEETKEEVAELLTDLFREAKDIDIENEVESNDVDYELIREDKLNTDPDEVAKYNTYMDAVFRRMNAALRAKFLDPIGLNLDSKQKKNPRNSKKDKNGAKSRKSRALEEEEPQEDEKEVVEEVNEEGVDRVGKVAKKKNKGDKKEKKDKSKLSKEERKEQKAAKKAAKLEKQKAKEAKRRNKGSKKDKSEKIAQRQKAKKRQTRDADDEEEDMNVDVEENKKSGKEKTKQSEKLMKRKTKEKKEKKDKKNKKDKKKKKKKKKSKKKKKKKKKKKDKLKKSKKTKEEKLERKQAKAQKQKQRKANKEAAKEETLSRGKRDNNSDKMKRNKQEEKARGSLSGIATLRRTKDVQIMDENGHKILTSYFAVGPLKLSVTKSLGEGQERTIKTAEATTDVMDGVMVLKVKPDGSAHVKKVEFQKPEKVDVTGSLNDAKERSESRIKNTFNKSRGLAANKLLKAARYVLKSNSKEEEESDAMTKE